MNVPSEHEWDEQGRCKWCPAIQEQLMDPSLEDKLAQIVGHLDDLHAGRRRQLDQRAIDSYLDDPQVASWLSTMRRADRVVNSRFTRTANDR
jgi:hypothetical protein